MALAMFDLDKTLIAGDSDFLWGEFMAEIGLVDAKSYQQQNQYFFDEYAKGNLNINAYLEFCLRPLTKHSIKTLNNLHKQFFNKKIAPIMLPKAQKVVEAHKKKGDTVLVITATNDFISTPIAAKYGINHVIASELVIKNNKYSGKIKGEPCYKEGKVNNLKKWLKHTNLNMKNASFYSDSCNDLALLELVAKPFVVNGDAILTKIAHKRGWHTFDWR